VVMNGTINAARDVKKLHSNRVETYQSLEFGPLGIVDRMGVKFYRVPLRRQTISINPVCCSSRPWPELVPSPVPSNLSPGHPRTAQC
jgi:L-asparaginase/Glu-tRNA(Gln) amidotransferase subunit D